MKHVLLFLALSLASISASATLKLQMQGNAHDVDVLKPMIGLSYYQPLFKFTALNAWMGYGDEPMEMKPDVDWFTAKAQFDMYWGKFTIAPGFQYKISAPGNEERSYPYVRIDYKLLD